jgi:hypothetical protein
LRECAHGDFDGYWRTFAQNATAAGRTGGNAVVSLAHEFNCTGFRCQSAARYKALWQQ